MIDDAIIIICSRADSKRVPQKCFRKVGGKSAIQHIVDRVRGSGISCFVAVPTGEKSLYSSLSQDIHVMEGNPESPLHRMVEVIAKVKKLFGNIPKYVIRITHDDLLIDTQTMLEVLDACRRENAGYGISPEIVDGAGVEVIATENILKAAEMNKEPVEHISYYVKGHGCPNPEIVTVQPRKEIRRRYRLTIDYPEDLIVLETIFRNVGPDASVDKICEFLDLNSYILAYNHLPEITVYTCAYNAERFIHQTILNVLRLPQDIEYIILDDCSTDKTLNEIMKYTAIKKDARLKVLTNDTNQGLSSSCNRVLSEARGRFIIRLDADDIFYHDALTKMVHEAKETGAAAVYSNYYEFVDDNSDYGVLVCGAKHHHAGCALFDTRLLRQIKFTEGLRHWDSLDIYNRIKNRFQIAYINEPLWLYRQRPDSMSHKNTKERREAKKEVSKLNGK